MITRELMDAVTQERMNDIARLQLEHDALAVSEGRNVAPASGPAARRGFQFPSFVARILRPATEC